MRPAPPLPYAALNLRRNPFGAVPPEERAALAVVEVGPLADALGDRLRPESREAPLAVQLVGPPGCGKSTWLAALQERFPEAPSVAWSAERGWPAVPGGPLLFVDDAHRMPWRLWLSLPGRRAVALATHRSLEPTLRRRGCDVRTVDLASLVTASRLRRIVERRLEGARRGPGPLPRIPGDELEALLERHGHDLRAVMDRLYDRIQRLA